MLFLVPCSEAYAAEKSNFQFYLDHTTYVLASYFSAVIEEYKF